MRWFGDISSGDATLRQWVCGGVLLDFLQRGDTPTALASNAMALVACSGYPLDGAAIVDRRIERCNLRHADLSGCYLSGTTFDRCELHDADFRFARVQGTTFSQCEFGLLRDLRGHTHSVTAVSVTPDGRQ